MKLQFLGAAREVTGSCTLIEAAGHRFLVDCGMEQGRDVYENTKLPCAPAEIEAILLTHGHFDHVGAVKALKERYPQVPVMIGALDEELLLEPERVYKGMLSRIPDSLHLKADRLLSDGDEIDVNGMHFTVIATPGHTPGSGCYYLEDNEILFSGDTLFHGSRGRTDFPGGSESEIMKSIREKLLKKLPDETAVLPGHNDSTTIGTEKVYY